VAPDNESVIPGMEGDRQKVNALADLLIAASEQPLERKQYVDVGFRRAADLIVACEEMIKTTADLLLSRTTVTSDEIREVLRGVDESRARVRALW
jgi:hypothetical protein